MWGMAMFRDRITWRDAAITDRMGTLQYIRTGDMNMHCLLRTGLGISGQLWLKICLLDQIGPDQTTPDKGRPDKTRLEKTRPTRQDKARTDPARADNIRPHKRGDELTRHAHQSSTGLVLSCRFWSVLRWVWCGLFWSSLVWYVLVWPGLLCIAYVFSLSDRTRPTQARQDQNRQDHTWPEPPDRIGPDMTRVPVHPWSILVCSFLFLSDLRWYGVAVSGLVWSSMVLCGLFCYG